MNIGNVVWVVSAGGILLAGLMLLWRGRASHGDSDDHSRHDHLELFARHDDLTAGGSRPVRVPVRVRSESPKGYGRRRR